MNPTGLVREHTKREYIEPARKRHDATVKVVVGDIQRALALKNRTPLICAALRSRKFLEENGLLIEKDEGPRSGLSTTVTLTYRLTGEKERSYQQDPWLSLKGSLKGTFAALGGGEAYIRKQREHFYEPDSDS